MRRNNGNRTITTLAEVVSNEALTSLAMLAGHQGLDPLFITCEVRDSLQRVGVRIKRALPEGTVSRVWRANVTAAARAKARGQGLLGYALIILLLILVAAAILALLGARVSLALGDSLGLPK